MSMATQSSITIALASDLDMDSIIEIESMSHVNPYTASEIHFQMKEPGVIAITVSELSDTDMVYFNTPVQKRSVVGYAFLRQLRKKTELTNFAIHPGSRRQGIASKLIDYIKSTLLAGNRIECFVREANVGAQCFLRSCGFEAKAVISGKYEQCDEDAYEFHYRNRGVTDDNSTRPTAAM